MNRPPQVACLPLSAMGGHHPKPRVRSQPYLREAKGAELTIKWP